MPPDQTALNPDDDLVSTFEPQGDDPHIVDVSDNDLVRLELFGSAGEEADPDDQLNGKGGWVYGLFDVGPFSFLEVYVADGRESYYSGGEAGDQGLDGGGATTVVADGSVELATADGGGGERLALLTPQGGVDYDGGGGARGGFAGTGGDEPADDGDGQGFGGRGGDAAADAYSGAGSVNPDWILGLDDETTGYPVDVFGWITDNDADFPGDYDPEDSDNVPLVTSVSADGTIGIDIHDEHEGYALVEDTPDPNVGYHVQLIDGTLIVVVGPDEVMSPTLPDEPSRIDEWQFEVPANTDFEQIRHGSALIFFERADGTRELLEAGPVEAVVTDDGAGTTTIRGKDRLHDLKGVGPESGRYEIDEESEVWDVIEDVWDAIDDWDADVTKPDPELIDEGRTIQEGEGDDVEGIFATSFEDGIAIFEQEDGGEEGDGWLRRPQEAWLYEATENDGGTFNNVVSDDGFVGGDAGTLEDISADPRWDFETDIEIPEGELQVHFRNANPDDSHPEFDVRVNNDVVETIPEDTLAQRDSPTWTSSASINSALEPGEHSVRLDASSGSGNLQVDAVALTDNRADHTLDDTLHEPGGHLDSPRPYKTETVAADIVEVGSGISAVRLDVDMDDTSADQELAAEFGPDDDEDDFEADVSEPNTLVLDEDNPGDLTSRIRGAVTLGATDDVRNDATPREGFEPQRLSEWGLAVDLKQVALIQGQNLRGSWFDILRDLHDRTAAGVFNSLPSGSPPWQAESFALGDLSGEADWTRLAFERAADTRGYANRLTAVGESDGGEDPPVVTVESSSEIFANGVVPAYEPFDEDDELALENRALTELGKRIRRDELGATLDIVPQPLRTGYVYHVDAIDDDLVLQRLEFDDGLDGRGQLEFRDEDDLADVLAGL